MKDTLRSLPSCFCFSVFLLVKLTSVGFCGQMHNLMSNKFKKSSLALRDLTIHEGSLVESILFILMDPPRVLSQLIPLL